MNGHTPEQIHANITAAIDWVLANPERHSRHDWAQTEQGYVTSPEEPDAYKFCVLGRLIVEAGLDTGETPLTVCGDYLRQINVSAGRLVDLNLKGRAGVCCAGYRNGRLVTRTHNPMQQEVEWGYHRFKEGIKR